jgi:glycerol uptake facilitator-like aquaporin
MIIAGCYRLALAVSHPRAYTDGGWTQSPLNPAIALAEVSYAMFDGNLDLMRNSWVFFSIGWFGSLLAVVCFEFVFKAAQKEVTEHEEA